MTTPDLPKKVKWNREEVCRLLDAEVTEETCQGGRVSILRFKDARSFYELFISETGVFLAADAERPVQGLPWFEISIPCTELAPLPRTAMPTGVGIFYGRIGLDSLCFSITRRKDGQISLSGAWDASYVAFRPTSPKPQ